MLKKAGFIIVSVMISMSALTGCGSNEQGSAGTNTSANTSYADGTYTATSSVYTNDDGTEDGNGYGTVTITIENGEITECTYQTFEVDGTLKDSDYGKKDGQIANRDYYSKAQKAVAACDEYARMLVENQGLDGIDAISGATVNYNEFVEAVTLALEEAAGE